MHRPKPFRDGRSHERSPRILLRCHRRQPARCRGICLYRLYCDPDHSLDVPAPRRSASLSLRTLSCYGTDALRERVVPYREALQRSSAACCRDRGALRKAWWSSFGCRSGALDRVAPGMCRAPWRGGSVHQLSEPPRWLAVLRRARRPRRGTLARDARFGFHGNQRRAGSQAARALGRRPVEVALPPRGAARGCVSSCPAWSRCPSDGNRSSCGRVRCGCPGICIRCHGQGAGSGGALRAVRRLRRVPPARQRAGQPRRPLAEDEGLGRERVEVAFREHIPLLRRAVPLREGTSPLSRQSPSTRTAQNLRRCCRFRRLGGMGFFSCTSDQCFTVDRLWASSLSFPAFVLAALVVFLVISEREEVGNRRGECETEEASEPSDETT